MIGHHTRLRENDELLLPGGGVLWEFLGGDVPLGPWNP